MRVNRQGSETNPVRVRAVCAAVVLLAIGGAFLGYGFRPHQSGATDLALLPSPLPTAAAVVHTPASLDQNSQTHVLAAFSHLPLIFEPNVGQSDPSVRFLARGAGYSLFLASDGATMALRRKDSPHAGSGTELLTMKLAGANPDSAIAGIDPLPGKTNYLLGGDSSRWHRNVPQFARVRYENVYPGINLLFYGNQRHLEYDFQVAPGADPSRAELEFDSAKRLALADGDLIVRGESGDVRLEAPHVYQQVNGRQRSVDGRFVLRAANRVGFEVGVYDRTRELIIDPILTYSTFFGGSGDDTSPSIAVDNVGNIFMAGSTTSANLPVTTGAKQTTLNGAQNVFILKLNPQLGANGIFYLTYLGGGGTDTSVGIGVDGAGNAYLAGTTTSGIGGTANFPTTGTNAYQQAPAAGSTGTSHVFVSVLDPTGSALKYSSYLSGNGTDVASGMAKDNKGNVYVTGTTTSNDAGSVSDQFPASAPPQAQPFQSFPRAPLQFFVTKVNTAAFGVGSITYSTYFGGGVPSNGTAIGGGIAVDSTGNIYFTGTTNFIYSGTSPTTDFPVLNAYQACLDVPTPNTTTGPVTCAATTATNNDAFVAKLNPNAPQGSQLIWSTYLGGTSVDSGAAIALDSGAASVYITGATNSSDVVSTQTFASYQLCLDTPVNPTSLLRTDCPAIASPAPNDAFIARLSNPSSGNMTLTYFSYLGGTADDEGSAITVDTAAGALVTGLTQSPDFPVFPNSTSNPLCTPSSPCVIQGTLNGPQDAFFARINTGATTGQNTVGNYATYFGGSATDRGTSITLDNNLSTYFAGDTDSTSPSFQTAAPLQAQNNGGTDAFVVKLGTAADLAITGKLSLTGGQQFVSAGSQATFTYTVTNNGPDVATNITVTADLSTAVTGVPLTFNSTSGCSQTSGNTNVVCSVAPLQSGSTATVTIVVTPTTAGSFNGGTVAVSSANNNDPVPGNNSVTVPATASDFTVDINPKNQSVAAAGDSATYIVTLTPVPVFSANVTIGCSQGVPNQASCSFTSNSVSLSNGPATSTLKLATTARPITVASSRPWRGALYALGLVVPGIAFFGFGTGNNRRRKLLGALLLSVLFGLLLLQPACSGGTKTPPVVSGTQAGTYTIVLAATGGVSHNVSFTLTVP
ncbi:MAG: SBBP repeat-containing protein [Acidobacteriia bacterium]|nr:SBBP repeat-containing protein [Terriglobia bacterium]